MPFRDKDWENFERDCTLFPAFTDYVFGPDERDVVFQEPGLHPMVLQHNPTLQQQNALYPLLESSSAASTPVAGEIDDSARALDLRSHGARIHPAEQTTAAPKAYNNTSQGMPASRYVRKSRTPSSRALTRRKNLNIASASHSPSPARPVPGQGRTLLSSAQHVSARDHIRMPLLLYSSPGTKVTITAIDGETDASILTTPQSHALGANTQFGHLGPPPAFAVPVSSPMAQQTAPQRPAHAISPQGRVIHPGELLYAPRYAGIQPAKLQLMDAKIVRLWKIIQNSPHDVEKSQAQAELESFSAMIHYGIQVAESRRSDPTYHPQPAQLQSVPIQSDNSMVDLTHANHSDHHYGSAPSGYPLPHHPHYLQAPPRLMPQTYTRQSVAPPQHGNIPPGFSDSMFPPLALGPPFPAGNQHGFSSSPQMVDTSKSSSQDPFTDAETQGPHSQINPGRYVPQHRISPMAPPQQWARNVFPDQPRDFGPIGSNRPTKQSNQALLTRGQGHQEGSTPGQSHQATPVLASQPVHQTQNTSSNVNRDTSNQTLLGITGNNLQDVRTYVDNHIPTLFAAYRTLMAASEAGTAKSLQERQEAQAWFNTFKDSLPPEGHAYLNEVFERLVLQSRMEKGAETGGRSR